MALSGPQLAGRFANKASKTFFGAFTQGVVQVLAMVVVAAGCWMGGDAALARETPSSVNVDAMPAVQLLALPEQGQRVYRLIHAGGPFTYDKDGTVFGNRERLLPRKARGFYREYTVPTPGARDRGARRIICGGQQPREPEACFYTEDHYASFRRIAP